MHGDRFDHFPWGVAEEAGFAYKDLDAVVGVLEQTGLSHRVATLSPLGNVEG